ncbi:alpha/beta hydrolase domain-containing protein [Frankia sp. R82]|uniref:alpha/beta hydrolase domain-containing protein n=1 Tax=Frankia sp. R82 TaxID=2950553 RepID=UPI0020447230|nr:alpha/beta hydrolase domain-containing protein [Frankia sp. R82]MCM3882619.1 alpha/beta hydrolase domain-containing protein [Frankia sp. R82]
MPTIQGPIANPRQTDYASYPLDKIGYAESEFFFSGTARAYSSATALASDGKWKVQPGASAAYRSRLTVLQPTDPAKFSGNVVVEWFNVTSGQDASPDWAYGHDEIVRNGDVYVGVSAQEGGVNQLKKGDPDRYGTLVHPGDSFAYDIFSQAGMAVRARTATLLPGLAPTVILGDGQSQSATALTTYVNAVAPTANVFDGYLIHSRAGTPLALSQSPQTRISAPSGTRIRDDLAVPVFELQTETDVLGIMHFLPARQPDTGRLRLWEVAGTAHVDTYVAVQSTNDDTGWGSDLAQFASMSSPPSGLNVTLQSGPLKLSCSGNLNTSQHHYVYQTALHDLAVWVRTGTEPPHMPPLTVDTSGSQPVFSLDADGNVLGGVRTPAVDAPVATLSGLPVKSTLDFCIFFGQTHPLTPGRLSALYPTHQDFVQKWKSAVASALSAGALLPADARILTDVV